MVLSRPKLTSAGVTLFRLLVVTLIVVILGERADLAFEITGEVVVLQQNPVLGNLMSAFDLALGLRMEWRAADMLHAFPFQPFS